MRQTGPVHARSAVVDLYGDHLGSRGWWAPVSAVVALASATGVQPPATRTAISRLVAQGWLEAARRGPLRGYAATPLAQERWRGAHRRIYAPGPAPWDGRWHLVHVAAQAERRRRDQVSSTLAYLGYGRLGGGGWLSPRPSTELAVSLDRLQVGWLAVHGPLEEEDVPALVARVWDLSELSAAYQDFSRTLAADGHSADASLADASPADAADLSSTDAADASPTDPTTAYRTRTRLVHEWRRFLFRDPDLPLAVLPPDWPGHRARRQFLAAAAALAPSAERYVDEVLGACGAPSGPSAGQETGPPDAGQETGHPDAGQ